MNDVSTLFEPRFVWSTRVCAEAAKVALRDGKTLKERVEIYERSIQHFRGFGAAALARERDHKHARKQLRRRPPTRPVWASGCHHDPNGLPARASLQ